MLVLTRKVNETITIGENIKVKVVKIKGNAVQLGIEAPDKTDIKRENEKEPRSPKHEPKP